MTAQTKNEYFEREDFNEKHSAGGYRVHHVGAAWRRRDFGKSFSDPKERELEVHDRRQNPHAGRRQNLQFV